MQKITKICSAITLCGLVGITSLVASNYVKVENTDAAGEMYSIVLSSKENRRFQPIYSPSTTFFDTQAGGRVGFEYNNFINHSSSYWGTIEYTGYIKNTQEINGLSKITITTDSIDGLPAPAAIQIQTSAFPTLDSRLDYMVADSAGSYTYEFTAPSKYFLISLELDSNVDLHIQEMVIEYTCV